MSPNEHSNGEKYPIQYPILNWLGRIPEYNSCTAKIFHIH